MVAQGLIRKISVGDMKNGITYIVGNHMLNGDIMVTEIRLDVNASEEIGMAKYDILVQKRGSENSRIWKSIEGMPVAVEYELEEEKDVEDTE